MSTRENFTIRQFLYYFPVGRSFMCISNAVMTQEVPTFLHVTQFTSCILTDQSSLMNHCLTPHHRSSSLDHLNGHLPLTPSKSTRNRSMRRPWFPPSHSIQPPDLSWQPKGTPGCDLSKSSGHPYFLHLSIPSGTRNPHLKPTDLLQLFLLKLIQVLIFYFFSQCRQTQ